MRVIVEELPPRGGRARFQLQAFVSGAVGELLDWLQPVLKGAKVKRWEGDFAFARVETDNKGRRVLLREAIAGLAGSPSVAIEIHATLSDEVPCWSERVGALAAVVEG